MTCISFLANKFFSPKGMGGGVRPLVEYSTIFFLFMKPSLSVFFKVRFLGFVDALVMCILYFFVYECKKVLMIHTLTIFIWLDKQVKLELDLLSSNHMLPTF